MRFNFQKLGPIHEGSIELSDLTILCGKNNTGKTYITNTVYSFLTNWKKLVNWELPTSLVHELYDNAVASIDLEKYIVDNWDDIIAKASINLKDRLSNYFACSSDRFRETTLSLNIILNDQWITDEFDHDFKSSSGKVFLSIKKPKYSTIAEIISTEVDGAPPIFVLDDVLSSALMSIVLRNSIPNTFIASAERTGASIFRNELNFNKNQLVRFLADMDNNPQSKFHPYDLVNKFKRNYAISVEDNVEFISSLSNIIETSSTSNFIENNSHLLKKFEEIAGGKYQMSKDGVLYFIPTHSKKTKLGLGESSSAVRSLMIIWYWLNYKANGGDLLVIDEPELNLHPENQRKLARFVVALVNSGIKVFMTTHSDYIIRELNTLLMLSGDKPHIKEVMRKYNYSEIDILDKSKIGFYNTTNKLFLIADSSKKKRLGSIERWDATDNGLKVESFDDEIKEMNRVQDALIYGL